MGSILYTFVCTVTEALRCASAMLGPIPGVYPHAANATQCHVVQTQGSSAKSNGRAFFSSFPFLLLLFVPASNPVPACCPFARSCCKVILPSIDRDSRRIVDFKAWNRGNDELPAKSPERNPMLTADLSCERLVRALEPLRLLHNSPYTCMHALCTAPHRTPFPPQLIRSYLHLPSPHGFCVPSQVLGKRGVWVN